MTSRQPNFRLIALAFLAIAFVSLGTLGRAARAAEAEWDKVDSAIKLIPEDAAFYSSMLRNREQFQALRRSNAWAKIEAMPSVQMLLSMYRTQLSNPESGPAQVEAALQNPEIRKIFDLVKDMFADEVFVYGDDSCIDFLELTQNVISDVRYRSTVPQAAGQAAPDATPRAIMAALAANVDLIAVPNFVAGFKLKNTELAKEELIKLETMANIMLEMNEKTKGRFKRTTVGNHNYLVLSLDGEMLPWDEVPMDQFIDVEAKPGDAQKIADRLKGSKLVIALGVRENYLLVSVGSTLECVERLGQGKRLVDRAELKRLAKFAGNRLTSIAYVSEDLNEQINSQRKNIDNAMELVDKLLPLAKLTVDQNKRIKSDAVAAADDLRRLLPKVGAQAGLSFLSERGIESCQYAWGDFSRLDSSKPLTLRSHVGGSPILAIVARTKLNVAEYDVLVKWVKTGYRYAEEFALPNATESEQKNFAKFMETARPLFDRLDKVNREKLFPAMADGQLGLVLDAKLASKQIVDSMPPTEKAMPMPEPALVFGVSDAKLLTSAMADYREIVNGLLDAARQVEGSEVPPDLRIPEPQMTVSETGTVCSFTLPKAWGVDPQIVPNFGLSQNVAVVSASPQHTLRLLKATPPASTGQSGTADRPIAVALWLDWNGLVKAATPWINFAVARAGQNNGTSEADQKLIADQVHTGINVLHAVQSVTAESYIDDGALFSHATLEIHDVP